MENNESKDNLVKQIDINKICRACLTDEGEMRSVFFNDTNNITQTLPLAEMLMAFSTVHITSGDGLPELICIQCVDQVSRVFTFKQQCERSETTLRHYLGKPLHIQQEELQQTQALLSGFVKPENTVNQKPPEIFQIKPVVEVQKTQSNDFYDGGLYLDNFGMDDDDDDSDESDTKTDTLLNDSTLDTEIDLLDEKAVAKRQLSRATQLHLTRLKIKKKLIAGKISKKSAKKLMKLKTNICDACKKPFVNMQSFRKHLRTHIEDRPFKCNECPRSFTEENYLNNHMRTHLPDEQKPLECNVCGKRFIHMTLLSKHLMKHSGEKPYVCKICNRGCYAENSLLKHMKIHERKQLDPGGLMKHICDYCKMEFTDDTSLAVHIKQHSGDRPFLCTICGKSFPQRFNLELHLRTHTGERPFACEICKNGYVSKASLKIHMRTHTNERPFVCDFCGKAFRQSGDLTSHKRLHGTEKPIECDICQKRFTTVMKLKYHMRNHTGERPYVCRVCNRGFTVNTILLRHMRVHSGERPYVCVICGKAFSQSSTLNTHMKVHSQASSPKYTKYQTEPARVQTKVDYAPPPLKVEYPQDHDRTIQLQSLNNADNRILMNQLLQTQQTQDQHRLLVVDNSRVLMGDVQLNNPVGHHDNRLMQDNHRLMVNDAMQTSMTSLLANPENERMLANNDNRLLIDNSRMLTDKYLVNYDPPYHHRGHL